METLLSDLFRYEFYEPYILENPELNPLSEENRQALDALKKRLPLEERLALEKISISRFGRERQAGMACFLYGLRAGLLLRKL